MVEDLRESRNVIDDHPDVEERLRSYLESLDAVVGEPTMPPLDEDTRERLRFLGYVK